MTRNEFLKKLTEGLNSLPPTRISEILEDINSHFTDGIADGVSEEKLCEMLGSPQTIAKEYVMQSSLGSAREHPTVKNIWRVVGIAIGLGFLNLIISLPVIAAIFAVWISVAATAFACIIAGVATIIAPPLYLIPSIRHLIYIEYPLLTFFTGITVAALGGLLGIFAIWSWKRLAQGLVGFIGANAVIITGRKKTKNVNAMNSADKENVPDHSYNTESEEIK